ncbi:MAG: hypothetical protein AAF518_11520 [Spirochaetota bacterium]
MRLVEFIINAKDSKLLKKIETTIQEELDKEMTPWETRYQKQNKTFLNCIFLSTQGQFR